MQVRPILKYLICAPLLLVVCAMVVGCIESQEPEKSKPTRTIKQVSAQKEGGGEHFHVALVGIGPGEPDLITIRAKRFLTSADRVVCFDWLTNEVAHQIGGPEKIEVVTFESLGGPDSRARAKFCAQVRRWVSAGEKVVFATSGDPTVCSPFGWVPNRLADWHPAVVPGVGSIPAGAAQLAQSIMDDGVVMVSTGDRFLDTDEKGRLSDVMVFFTHLRPIDQLLPELVKRYPGDTPVAIVGDVARVGVEPVVIRATLATLEEQLSKTELPKLYLVFVGDPLKQDTTRSLPDHHHRFDKPDQS